MKAIALLVVLVPAALHADPDVDEPAPAPRWKAMLVESAGLIALGEAYYYRGDGRASAGDWQLSGNLDALGRKLTGDGIRYDSNGFVTNAVKHPILFGAGMHELAREHGYSLGESFLISSAMSVGWEFIGEWREYASINDLMTTSTAGTPVGESVYQLVHHWRDAKYDVHAGLGRVGVTGFRTIGASAELGRNALLALEVPFDSSVRAIDFRARTTVWGRTFDRVFVGAVTTYDYRQKMDRPEWQWDLLANVRGGPTLDLAVREGGLAAHAGVDATVDFAMVKSYAYGTWRDEHPVDVVQGVLEAKWNTHYYYYAAGLTLEPRVSLEYAGFAAGASFEGSLFRSLDGHDRDQEIETTHIHLDDSDRTIKGWLGARIHGATVRVEAREQRRAGQIGMVEDHSTERTAVLTVGYAN